MAADLFSDFSLGDVVVKRSSQVVEYNATITKGQGLNVESTNSDGQLIVGVAAAGEKAQFVAMFSGVDGDLHEALSSGIVKITFGGAVAAGAPVKAGATGKFVAAVRTVTVPTGTTAVTSSGAQPAMTVEGGIACGTCISVASNDGDTGLIDFVGGVTP